MSSTIFLLQSLSFATYFTFPGMGHSNFSFTGPTYYESLIFRSNFELIAQNWGSVCKRWGGVGKSLQILRTSQFQENVVENSSNKAHETTH